VLNPLSAKNVQVEENKKLGTASPKHVLEVLPKEGRVVEVPCPLRDHLRRHQVTCNGRSSCCETWACTFCFSGDTA